MPEADALLKRRDTSARCANIPRATYRIQLNSAFTFRDATALAPYLAELGVSHVYCSPYFRARPGSTHGYDVVDHNTLNPEIGTREEFDVFVQTLHEHGLGQILDIVPNHVGVMGADNARWMDVLENGQASIYAQFFDIDWRPSNPLLADKVLAPVLGEPYGAVLERGEIELRFEADSGSISAFYHEHRLPLDPRDYAGILERALALIPNDSVSRNDRTELAGLVAAFSHLPDRHNTTPADSAERNRDKELYKARLSALSTGNPAIAEAIHAAVRELTGTADDPASIDRLHELLDSQAYRLAYWRVASDEINYRRFFDINDLAALRMENEAVFEATHRLVFDLLNSGAVDGLRIDHPDGLNNPAQYFRRLQRCAGSALGSSHDLPLYLVVEKITAGFERLPSDWPVHGTTGYHFTHVMNGVFIDGATKARFDRLYRAFIGEPADWPPMAHEAKRFIVSTSLAAELNILAVQLVRIARAERSTRDFTLNNLRQALVEMISCFPVYRTYIADDVSAEDRRYIDWAHACAKRGGASTDGAVYDFVRDVLVDPGKKDSRTFAMKFQQVTAPVTAKGVEDTAMYRFNRLISLNEVGGEPDTYGTTVRAFHSDSQQRARNWPHEMLATSTHDTKRSEDVRSRINVLSEMATPWRAAIERWRRLNRSRKKVLEGHPAPSPNDEYLLYQTLIGSIPLDDGEDAAWSDYVDRIDACMVKAVREAKLRSSWGNPNTEYEEAVRQFVRAALERRDGNLFLTDILALVRRIARFGLFNGLSQTLCKLTAPGVPDIYQGNELWDFSLVDPDNRRPVDYALRRRLLAEAQAASSSQQLSLAEYARSLVDSLEDGRSKLHVTWRALQLRRAHEELFRDGEYLPLRVTGQHASRVVAFARRLADEMAIVIAPRLYLRLLGQDERPPLGPDVWADTTIELPRRIHLESMRNVLDGTTVALEQRDGRRVINVGKVLTHFPVALLSTS